MGWRHDSYKTTYISTQSCYVKSLHAAQKLFMYVYESPGFLGGNYPSFVFVVLVSKAFFENIINTMPVVKTGLLQRFIFSLDFFLEFLGT